MTAIPASNPSIQLVSPTAMRVRPADQRGQGDLGWLKARYSFSFADYHDPAHMNFENLRVINDDLIAPGGGFPMHAHQDFEIFSYILNGAIEHTDSMGNGSTVSAGGVQYMSAGSGARHSEFNPSSEDQLRLLQVWLRPNVLGADPKYEFLDITPDEKDGRMKLFLSRDGRGGSVKIRANADVYAATLTGHQEISFEISETNKAWIQVARGSMTVNETALKEGDGLAVERSGHLVFGNGMDAEFLLFDLGTE